MKTRIDTPAAILWASAFLLAALVLMQAGKLEVNPAYADQAVERGGYTLSTSSAGRGEAELLWIVDARDQMLYVYDIENIQQESIILRQAASLPVWFRNARR